MKEEDGLCPVCGEELHKKKMFWHMFLRVPIGEQEYDCPKCNNEGTWDELVKAAHQSH